MKLLMIISAVAMLAIVYGVAAQDKASSTVQKAGDCSVNISGKDNTASLVCNDIDPKLAEQVQAIINGTRRNESAIKEMSGKLNLILKQMFKEAIPPDVGLRFVMPASPALVLINKSDAIAKDIRWQVTLWDIDLTDRMDSLPIILPQPGWLKAHAEFAPQDVFSGVASMLRPGDRLVGSASANCAECDRGRTYLVYIVWGQGGWFSEVESERTGNVYFPPGRPPVTKEKLSAFLSVIQATPEQLRTEIKNWPP